MITPDTWQYKDDKNPQVPERINGRLSGVTPLQHNGLYATVWTAQYEETPVVIKKYAAPDDIDESLMNWREYCSSIDKVSQKTGISITRNVDIHIGNGDVYFIDEHAGGPDVSKIISDDSVSLEDRYALTLSLLSSLASIPKDQTGKLDYMIDGKISNFCLNSDGGFVYIDTFPAFVRQQDSNLLEPFAEHKNGSRNIFFDSFITGDMYGVLGKYIGTLKREHSEVYAFLKSEWDNETCLPEVARDIREYVGFLLEDENAFIETLYRYNREDETTANRLLNLAAS